MSRRVMRALLPVLSALFCAACTTPVVSLGDDHAADAAVGGGLDASVPLMDAAHVEDADDIDDELECNEHEPVCGVDHVTYFNKCVAADAGVIIEHGGSCS